MTLYFSMITAVSLSVKDNNSGATYQCGNEAAPEECQYKTVSSDSAPTIDSLTDGGDTLTLTGSNFNQDDCVVTVLGVESNSCTINSATEVVAQFTNGLPVTKNQVVPALSLMQDCAASMTDLCTANSLQSKTMATS